MNTPSPYGMQPHPQPHPPYGGGSGVARGGKGKQVFVSPLHGHGLETRGAVRGLGKARFKAPIIN